MIVCGSNISPEITKHLVDLRSKLHRIKSHDGLETMMLNLNLPSSKKKDQKRDQENKSKVSWASLHHTYIFQRKPGKEVQGRQKRRTRERINLEPKSTYRSRFFLDMASVSLFYFAFLFLFTLGLVV